MKLNDIRNLPEYPAILARFERLYIKGTDDECWMWQGGLGGKPAWAGDERRYGRFPLGKYTRQENAHRVSYAFYVGDIPDGLWVLHKCDTPQCVNPNHLFIGTAGDNNRDAIAKGRHAPRLAALRANRSDEFIRRVREFPGSNSQAAKHFGLSRSVAGKIRAGKTWAHLPVIPRHPTKAQMLELLRSVRDLHRG